MVMPSAATHLQMPQQQHEEDDSEAFRLEMLQQLYNAGVAPVL